MKKAVQLSAGNPLTLGSLGHAYARAGRPAEALRVLNDLQSRQASGTYVPPFAMALIRVGLCDKHAAFDMLEHAAKEHSPLLGLWLTTEPRLAHLRSHSRYSKLIATTDLCEIERRAAPRAFPQGGSTMRSTAGANLVSLSIHRAGFAKIHISRNGIEPRSLAQICSAEERECPCRHSLKAPGSIRDES